VDEFRGFPAVAQGTVIPNLFFAAVLPRLETPEALLAFLWASRLCQAKKGELRCVSVEEVLAEPGALASFANLAGDGESTTLDRGLADAARAGALLGVRVLAAGDTRVVYFVNNPASRRAIFRLRAGDLSLGPNTAVEPIATEDRPSIFRLYEENVGTITPLVGEQLLAAADHYPLEWIADAFKEAALSNARSWRFIERILTRWDQEGRDSEGTEGSSFEERRRRYRGAASPG